ncbi:unnamed protein product [marine sediment metagenome]|uniref:Response regulatory domain-containing protein n=1 Tax=marine sediment metagenome TaxID=412755 RepID=X1D2B0_9ZZZZ
MKILIVDDNKQNLYMLETLLKSCSYDVVSAANGVEALANLREGEIDLIISDILMPQMDGFQLCRECKKDNKLKDIPFVFYTATYTEDKDEEFAMKLGIDRFIRKPEEPDKFIEIIQDVISNTVSAKIKPQKAISEEEKEIFKLYNERLVNKLEKKMLDLETEVSERKKYEAKVTHLNLVLRAIRSVNHLIIREKDPEKLIRQACMNLIATRGYSSAWIALLNENNN